MALGLFSVKQYTPSTFKICEFKRCIGGSESRTLHPSDLVSMAAPLDAPPSKFDSSLSRAKAQVYQYAVCNDWDWFCTFTLDKKLRDRFDLKGFNRDLSLFLRHYRRKAPELRFLLIPEQHKDGAWHMHGLIAGLPEDLLSEFDPGTVRQFFGRRRKSKLEQLRRKGYFNWPDYAKRFGFVSMGRIRSNDACARYITKYISKSLSSRVFEVGSHLYYVSRGLKRAERVLFDWACVPDQLQHIFDFDGEFVRSGWLSGDRLDILSLFASADLDLKETEDDFTVVVDDDHPWLQRELPWSVIESDYQIKLGCVYDSQEDQAEKSQSPPGTLHCRTC